MKNLQVYIDYPIFKKKNGRKKYAHLTSTNIERLHLFASIIGVKKHFFHTGRIPHYDITEEQCEKALEEGATLLSTKEMVRILKNDSQNT